MGLVAGNLLPSPNGVARCADRVYAGRSSTREAVALLSRLGTRLTFGNVVSVVALDGSSYAAMARLSPGLLGAAMWPVSPGTVQSRSGE